VISKITGGPYEELPQKEYVFMAQFANNSMVVEKASIVVIPFLLVLFHRHRLVYDFSYQVLPPDAALLAENAAAQFAIQTLVDYICIVVGNLQDIPINSLWRDKRVIYTLWEMANTVQIITLIIYMFRVLPFRAICTSLDPCSCTGGVSQSLALLPNFAWYNCSQT